MRFIKSTSLDRVMSKHGDIVESRYLEDDQTQLQQHDASEP
ncbi:hypothetical protein [Paraburkholderia haematera]|nr:hypothetical protein [Paraburkholderia haematera]